MGEKEGSLAIFFWLIYTLAVWWWGWYARDNNVLYFRTGVTDVLTLLVNAKNVRKMGLATTFESQRDRVYSSDATHPMALEIDHRELTNRVSCEQVHTGLLLLIAQKGPSVQLSP